MRRWKSLVIYCLCMCLMSWCWNSRQYWVISMVWWCLMHVFSCIFELHCWSCIIQLHYFKGSPAQDVNSWLLPQQRNILFLIYRLHRLCHGSKIKHTIQFYVLLPPWVQKMHCRNFAIHSIQINITHLPCNCYTVVLSGFVHPPTLILNTSRVRNRIFL